jgi:hypothetical protein
MSRYLSLGELQNEYVKRRRRRELEHGGYRARTPGYPEYASGAINDLATVENLSSTGLPIVSDAADAALASDAARRGNWGEAAMYGAALALPFVSGPFIKAGVDAAGRYLGPVGDVPADPNAANLLELEAYRRGTPAGGELAAPNINSRVQRGAAQEGASSQRIHAQARKEGRRMTVKNPTAMAYPRIYDRPDELVARAKVAPEDESLKRLFGVTRADLYEIAQQGTRQGNLTERPYRTAKNPKGAAHAQNVMTPQNAQRILDIIEEARKRPDLYQGMAAWYTMDPLYQRFVEIHGPEKALEAYRQFNTLTGMASPGSEVLTELNRGTAANMLASEGRFDDFMVYGGVPEHKRGPDFPEHMRAVQGHAYHKTAQGLPMQTYLDTGEVRMSSAKVPSYIRASGVPETGFQTKYPVGDAHWSRIVGLPDVRNLSTAGGEVKPATASASVPEMVAITPWWQKEIAEEAGIEPVPAQAVVWGAGANATGVTSPVGAPKLELLAMQIMKAAKRMGVSPEEARDLIIAGKAHAGNIDPALLAALGGGGAAAAAVTPYLLRMQEDEQ